MGLFKKIKEFFSGKYTTETENKFRIKTISEMTDSEKEILRQEYSKFKEEFYKRVNESYKLIRQEVDKSNSCCSKCKSNNVNNRIKRIEGQINGSSSGYGSSSLFGGSFHTSGSISGKIDTEPVNKCNDCQHEWKVVQYYSPRMSTLEDVSDSIYSGLRTLSDAYKDPKFDPNDLSEKFSSAEEKKKHAISNIKNDYWVENLSKMFNGYSIELIQYIFLEESKRFRYSYYDDQWEKFDKSLLQSVLNFKSICNK